MNNETSNRIETKLIRKLFNNGCCLLKVLNTSLHVNAVLVLYSIASNICDTYIISSK